MQTKAETHNFHALTSQYSRAYLTIFTRLPHNIQRAYLTIHAGLRHFGDLLFSW